MMIDLSERVQQGEFWRGLQNCFKLAQTDFQAVPVSHTLKGVKWMQLVGTRPDGDCVCRCHDLVLDGTTGYEEGEIRIVPSTCLQSWFEKEGRGRPTLFVMAGNTAASARNEFARHNGDCESGDGAAGDVATHSVTAALLEMRDGADDHTHKSNDDDSDLFKRYDTSKS